MRGPSLDALSPYDAGLIRERFDFVMLDLWCFIVSPQQARENSLKLGLPDTQEHVRLFGYALKALGDTCRGLRDRAGATRLRWEQALQLISSLTCTERSCLL